MLIYLSRSLALLFSTPTILFPLFFLLARLKGRKITLLAAGACGLRSHSSEGKSLCYHLKVNANLFFCFYSSPTCLVALLQLTPDYYNKPFHQSFEAAFWCLPARPLLDFPASRRRLRRQRLCSAGRWYFLAGWKFLGTLWTHHKVLLFR